MDRLSWTAISTALPTADRWQTGDIGTLEPDGFLRVKGRKDSLIVTASGRNISPEWVEAMVMSDPRVAACVALGHGMDHCACCSSPQRSANAG